MEDVVLLELGDLALYPEVADVVEFNLLLVVSQQEGLTEEGGGGVVDGGPLDHLAVVDHILGVSCPVVFSEGKGVGIDLLHWRGITGACLLGVSE